VIRPQPKTDLWRAECDGALDCNATSKPSPRNWAASTAKRAGWHVQPGLFPDGKEANMGVTICPRCNDLLSLDNMHNVDTGSDDRPPPPKAKTLAPQDIMPDLIRKIRETIREQR
jgi:hypothetical protein